MLMLMEEPRPKTKPEARPEPIIISPSRRKTRPRARWYIRVARVALLIFLGVIVVLVSLQTQLIFPGQQSQGKPAARFDAPPGTELLSLKTPNGQRIAALFGPALDERGRPLADARSRPTLLFLYGNAMFLKAALPEFESFRRLGLNVLIPDYLGYGMSEGKAGEAECYQTAETSYEHLRERKDIDPNKIIAGGWSLGGAVALDLAAHKPVAGLMLFSSFTSMADVIHKHYPFVPASLLLRHRFESLRKIKRVPCPILIGHGRDDAIIPCAMSSRLATAARASVATFTVEDAGHNDFFLMGGQQVQREIRAFLLESGLVSR